MKRKKVPLEEQLKLEEKIIRDLEFVDDLPSSNRCKNALKKRGIYNTVQLKDYYLQHEELLRAFIDIRNIRSKSIKLFRVGKRNERTHNDN